MGPAVLVEEAGLKKELSALKTLGLHRAPETVSGIRGHRILIGSQWLVNFSSNNYLGLAQHPFVIQKTASAVKKWGAGSGASRLLSGNLKIHRELEGRIASFKNEEAALILSLRTLANVGAVTALLNQTDLVLADRNNHASLIDAARLSKAKFRVYPHRDLTALEKLLGSATGHRRKLVTTDAYFSMDGTVAPLDKILEVCRRHGALLLVDEAHSTGVFGRTGRGLTEHFGVSGKIDVVMGTLSKALGSVGGFIAGTSILKETLINRSKEFIYTTAPSPASSAAALASLELIETKPEFRKKLWKNIDLVRRGLSEAGFDLMGSEGPIIPILIGDTKRAVAIKEFLAKEGIFAPAIRPPTVSKGTDRLRLSVTAQHDESDIERLLSALKKVRTKLR